MTRPTPIDGGDGYDLPLYGDGPDCYECHGSGGVVPCDCEACGGVGFVDGSLAWNPFTDPDREGE